MTSKIPFNKPHLTGSELQNIEEAHRCGQLAGDGRFTHLCQRWLEDSLQTHRALLTHSCTAALEMAALLIGIQPGDEVIMPSYTFVSTANAFVLRGGIPVFIDIREDTLNLDEAKIEEAITEKTKAIVPVHYAGVACEMDTILDLAEQYGLRIIEDAAQGIVASYNGKPLGTIGDLGTLSFHETKNIISGEGGALVVNREEFVHPAEIIREKGTNRSQFFRGETDKYTWQSVGSSYLPGELIAAFLWAQLEQAEQISQLRLRLWNQYFELTKQLEEAGLLRRPRVPESCQHNAHIYYVLLQQGIDRSMILEQMKAKGVHAVFHYVPLHSSPAGKKFGRVQGKLENTDQLAERLIRLPLWIGMSDSEQERIVEAMGLAIQSASEVLR